MRKVPQKIWSSIFLILLVIIPAVLYIQLIVENANDKQLQLLSNIQNKLPTGNDKVSIVETEKENGNQKGNKVDTGKDEAEDELVKCVLEKDKKQCWRESKRKSWLRGLDRIDKLPESDLAKFRHKNTKWEVFDLITPTHECDLNQFSREGMGGDGGKWICGPLTTDDNCVIFSLGSHGQFDFEQSMQRYTKGKCKMHTFDCTGTWSDPSTTFHPWCIAGNDYTDKDGKIYKRISTIFKELGLKEINYLKMDIEGYEWPVFSDILKPENKFALPRQISFELHVHDTSFPPKEDFKGTENWAYPMIKLLKTIDQAGYRFAATELNTLCPVCSEYVIVREDVM